jgi:hypothetical protein
MPTLVINAPRYQAKNQPKSKRSFSKTIEIGIGKGYALNSKILPRVQKASKVIVLDKSAQNEATGLIDKINSTGQKTGNGILRYDIYMSKLERSKNYRHGCVPLNRNGVAII